MVTLHEHPYAQIIWDSLIAKIKNKYGVAGLMGNLQAESGLYPDRVQGDVPYSSFSQEYTAQVNSGTISKNDFIHNGVNGGGYGLAQWTYYTRKEALYERWKSGGYDSIGSAYLACDFLLWELESSYSDVFETLVNASSIRQASDKVLHDFENPADQSAEVEALRASMGEAIYEAFSGSTPITPTTKKNRLSKLLLMAVAVDE